MPSIQKRSFILRMQQLCLKVKDFLRSCITWDQLFATIKSATKLWVFFETELYVHLRTYWCNIPCAYSFSLSLIPAWDHFNGHDVCENITKFYLTTIDLVHIYTRKTCLTDQWILSNVRADKVLSQYTWTTLTKFWSGLYIFISIRLLQPF